jgi:hypothetical protein
MEKLYGGNAGVVRCGGELSRRHTKACNYKASLQQCEMQKFLTAKHAKKGPEVREENH